MIKIKQTDIIRQFFDTTARYLRELEMYINLDNLAKIELIMSHVEDGLQALREEIRSILVPKPKKKPPVKKKPVGRPPKNAASKTKN
ncbi:MAG: hypothetical protein GY853_16450 [PVC group bacterium]|nr:hypothetical protein [PVC group bacterium]